MSAQQLIVAPRPESDGPPLLSLDLTGTGGLRVIRVSGDIDMNTAHLITDLVRQVARERPERVVLDLTEVSFFGADGVRTLLHARTAVTAAGGQLVLRAPSQQTRLVLAITRTEHLFPLA